MAFSQSEKYKPVRSDCVGLRRRDRRTFVIRRGYKEDEVNLGERVIDRNVFGQPGRLEEAFAKQVASRLAIAECRRAETVLDRSRRWSQ